MNNIHVLLLPSWYPTTDSPINGIFFQEQAQALHNAGVKIGVIYPDLKSIIQIKLNALKENHFQFSLDIENEIPTIRFHGWTPPKMLRLSGKWFVHFAHKLTERYIKNYGKPDVIHAHSILWGGGAAQSIKNRFGIPYVVTEHSSTFARQLIKPFQIPDIKQTISEADDMITVSNSLAKEIAPYAHGKKIKVIPNIVNTDFFKLALHPRTINPFRFLTVALLTPNKGIDILIRAFASAFKDNGNIVLEIGGDGEHKTELNNLVKELGIAKQVSFLGMLSREQVREAMWRANVFVLPSYIETFGVVFIEAMATGLPVIATRCGGPEDFVSTNVGWLIKAGDIKELVTTLLEAHQYYAQYEATNIRDYIVKNYSEEAVTNSLIKCYQAVLSTHATSLNSSPLAQKHSRQRA